MEDNTPDHIKEYEDLKKKSKKLADTTEAAHSEAFLNLLNAKREDGTYVLRDEKGEIDYSLLDKKDVQEEARDLLVDFYVKKANEAFGSDIKKEDKFKVDLLMKAYSAPTYNELDKLIKTHKSDYNLKKHESVRENFVGKIKEDLYKTTKANIKKEHIGDFVKHMGIEDIVDTSQMKVEDISMLHDMYKESEALSPKLIEKTYSASNAPKPIYLKKKKAADNYETDKAA